MIEHYNGPNFVYPAGTQIVTVHPLTRTDGEMRPAGAVGVILLSPGRVDGPYLVRFPDEEEVDLRGDEFRARKHFERDGLLTVSVRSADFDTYGAYIIYRCVVGSRAYGLAADDSDTDRRGIYLAPAEQEWSLAGVPEQIESHATEETYWELEKFIRLALKANPNILECLYTPLVTYASRLAQQLREQRSMFLSKLVYQTYNGYVMSQFKKMQKDLENRGEVRWKHAMHLIRLLLAGIAILEEGEVPVNVAAQREVLLPIKRGELTLDEVNAWRLDLHRRFDAAYEATALPERPDYEAANSFLIAARRSMACD